MYVFNCFKHVQMYEMFYIGMWHYNKIKYLVFIYVIFGIKIIQYHMFRRVNQNYQRKIDINLKELIDRFNWIIVFIFKFFKHFFLIVLNSKRQPMWWYTSVHFYRLLNNNIVSVRVETSPISLFHNMEIFREVVWSKMFNV